ncbi:MAG TPA: GGDEF domain-containing protein [Albitalea sp.]|nr:GGDEF domain-containing protein [Albitalea sp.]
MWSPSRPPEAATPALGRPMLVLQALGALAMLTVWGMEMHAGVSTPWDRWLLPGCAAVIGLCTALTLRWPALEPSLRVVPMGTFNLYLVAALHASLAFTSGEEQRYQVITNLFWVPLGYGCAFVFLRLRAALVVSGLTAAGIFVPLLWFAQQHRLPDWLIGDDPLLPQVALSQAMFVALLTAVVRLRSSHDRAQAHVALMRELAVTDPLTGLPNRRGTTDRLDAAMAMVARHGQPLSVALIDVDNFKSINDRYGHAAGDAVLHRLAQTMQQATRATDMLGRWGGEEFLLLAPATSAPAAGELAERVRRAVAAQAFAHGEPVTISVGVSTCWSADRVEALLRRADDALYRAKAGGRDRVEPSASPGAAVSA